MAEMGVKTAVRQMAGLPLVALPLLCVGVLVLSLGASVAFAQDADSWKEVKGANYSGVPG
jgi:hypothetical protein